MTHEEMQARVYKNAMKKKQEDKRKLKKLKMEQMLLTQDRNIESTCLLFILTLFSLLICHDQQASYLCIVYASCKKFG